MQRQLPIAEIEGVEFYVDAHREELWQVRDPQNRISFNAFRPCKEGYILLYDKKSGCAAQGKERVNRYLGSHRWILLPALMELDPDGIALRYGIPVEMLSPSSMPRPPKKVVASLTAIPHLK